MRLSPDGQKKLRTCSCRPCSHNRYVARGPELTIRTRSPGQDSREGDNGRNPSCLCVSSCEIGAAGFAPVAGAQNTRRTLLMTCADDCRPVTSPLWCTSIPLVTFARRLPSPSLAAAQVVQPCHCPIRALPRRASPFPAMVVLASPSRRSNTRLSVLSGNANSKAQY